MRIGYLIPEFPAQTHAFFWREAMALESLGIEVMFLSTRRPAEYASRHAFTDAAVARTAYLFPPRAGAALRHLAARPVGTARALSYLAGLRESPWRDRLRGLAFLVAGAELARLARAAALDHIHVHSFANAAHVAALARLLDGPSYSLTLHGDLPVYGRDHAAKAARAAFLTTVTGPLAETVRAAIPGAEPAVIAMGVDTDRFTPAPPPPGPPLRLLSVARLNYVKGHVHLLRAMAALVGEGQDLHYVIAGDGPYRPEIEAEIARLGLNGRVEMTGSVGEERVLDLLRGAHVFALTSFGLGEAAPVAVMEAMACGLAVICSRIGGTGDMIADGTDGLLVPQQDEAAIAAALRRLADPDERARIGATARARAVRQFDYRARAADLAALIRARAGQRG